MEHIFSAAPGLRWKVGPSVLDQTLIFLCCGGLASESNRSARSVRALLHHVTQSLRPFKGHQSVLVEPVRLFPVHLLLAQHPSPLTARNFVAHSPLAGRLWLFLLSSHCESACTAGCSCGCRPFVFAHKGSVSAVVPSSLRSRLRRRGGVQDLPWHQ